MPSIFDDEIAADVRDDYHELLRGRPRATATDELIADYEELLADDDQAGMVWVALAATQLELGEVEGRVKEKALQAIGSGGAFSRRRPLSQAARAERQAALDELQQRLA